MTLINPQTPITLLFKAQIYSTAKAYFCFEISIRWLAYQVPRDALSDNSFLFDLFLAAGSSGRREMGEDKKGTLF